MTRHAPATRLLTHEVTNQVGDAGDVDLFGSDAPFAEAVRREAGAWLETRCAALGRVAGTERVRELGEFANRHKPELVSFDRYGRRVDEVRFHPAYHELMALATSHGIHDVAWTERRPGRHVGHAAMLALFTQAEAGTMCPINMTYASVPALRRAGDVGAPWIGRIVGGTYDAPLRPIAEKSGITFGMAMTEKQGGSDVRANATRARPAGDGTWRLRGHKWFCSAPMSDGFLTLAHTEAGLSCFLVPRILPDGERNTLQIMRLKDKLGNCSNASSEIEYHDTYAELMGEDGRGLAVVLEMVHHTRLGTIAGTLGLMRAALAEAARHVRGRRAFQKTLIDQPAMRGVVADLALEYEAAVALVMRVARAFDAESGSERAFARLAVAVSKYWLTKRCPGFVYECMECLGGGGYVEESPMPRLFRESPLNAIWEGSGNVIALDILRSIARVPESLDALLAEIDPVRGREPLLDAAASDLRSALSGHPSEGEARWLAERLALVLQGALLVRHTPDSVAQAFLSTRLGDGSARCYGTLAKGTDFETILARV